MMSLEENKVLVSRWLAAWKTGPLDELDALAAPDYRHHSHSNPAVDLGSFKRGLGSVLVALPDYQATIEDLAAEEDRVFARWTARGTHNGPFDPFQPTGRTATAAGMTSYLIVGDRIAADWEVIDMAGFFQQLGAGPAGGAAPAGDIG